MNAFQRFLSVTAIVSAMVAGNATATQPETSPAQYTLTAEQRQQVEESWEKALFFHAEKLTRFFTQSLPDSHQSFITFRNREWQLDFERDWNKARAGWKSLADRNRSTDYNRLRELHNSFAILNSASLDMAGYLETGDKKWLEKVREQLAIIEAIEKTP